MNSAMTSRRAPTQTATTGSTTTLETTPHSPQGRLVPLIGTLRLRAEPVPRRGIRWAEDVVDNEGLGRKSSKVCCIYHKPRAVGESSSEEDSDSSESESESDSEPDNSTARKAKSSKREKHGHEHGKECEGGHDHDHEHSSAAHKRRGKRVKRTRKSPNAYEKMPKRGGTMTETMK